MGIRRASDRERLLASLENDQTSVGMALFAARDLFRWLQNLRARGKVTREEWRSMDRLVREIVRGLTVNKKWLEWVRWGRNLRIGRRDGGA